MARDDTLRFLLERARQDAEAAARRYAAANQALAAQRQKLDGLAGYQGDYRQRLAAAGARGIDIQRLRDWYGFMGRLDEAARMQQQEIERAARSAEQARQAWQQCRQKVSAYEALVARAARARQLAENRREQKQTDERAGRRGAGAFDSD